MGVQHVSAEQHPSFIGVGDDFDNLESQIVNPHFHQIGGHCLSEAAYPANWNGTQLKESEGLNEGIW